MPKKEAILRKSSSENGEIRINIILYNLYHYYISMYLGHFYFAISLEKEVSYRHAYKIRTQSGPWLIIDFIEKRQWIIRARHMIIY